jgi:predicted ATPase/DNA-binding SARP family transcriptional activator
MRVVIGLMGGFEVTVDGAAIPREAWRRRQPAQLVKLLALAPGHRLHREQVMDALWPDLMIDEAAPRLHKAAHYARATLGSRDAIAIAKETVSLFPSAELTVDVDRFDTLEAAARSAASEDATAAAIAAYAGDVLPDDPYEEWAVEARDRRRLRYLDLLRRGERWEELVAADPTDEEAHVRVVEALIARGDRAGALHQLDFMEAALRRAFDLEPGDVAVALRQQVLAMSVGTHAGGAVRVPRTSTPTIGRDDEIARVTKLLEEAAIVTLLGPGGVGKTRLATEVALRGEQVHGWDACFVDLTRVRDAALVPGLIVRDLGIHLAAESDAISVLNEALRGARRLLVLDNFEHVIDAAPVVGELTRWSPDVRVLATSRARLRITGEVVFDVEPLDVEGDGALTGDAVRLFAQTAAAIDPTFALDRHIDDVVAICRAIDGLPLAIELAAGQVRALPPALLRTRLGDRLAAASAAARDAPERHQTVPATIDWSLQLLGDTERQLFVLLGVFESAVPLSAIEAVCAAPGLDVVDALGRLVDQSLVKRTIERDEPRFVLLELLRERARELLGDEGHEARRRHADYFGRFLDEVDERRWRDLAHCWIDLIADMLAEIRASHAWAIEHDDSQLAARLTSGLGTFWHREGNHAEGRRWVADALTRLDQLDDWLAGRVLLAAGFVEWPRDQSATLRHWEQATEIFRRLGDARYLSYALGLSAGCFIGDAERYHEALQRSDEAINLARKVGELPLIAQALNVKGELARVHGDDASALIAYEEGLELARSAGDGAHTTVFLANLSYLADHRGDYDTARELNLEALRMCRALGRRMMAAWTLSELAGPEVGFERPERGALFVGAADAALQTLGVGRHPGDRPEHDRVLAQLAAALGDERSQALQREGAQMSLDEAIDLALADDMGSTPDR